MNDKELDIYIARMESAFHKTMHKLGHVMEEQLRSDLTGPQFIILRMLLEKGTMTASELANALSVKPSAVTAMIDRMHKLDMVERNRDENDRRVVFISISENGREICERAERKRKKVMRHYLSHFEPEELETLVRLYEKLGNVITQVDWNEDDEK